jgi:hypothetical protein
MEQQDGEVIETQMTDRPLIKRRMSASFDGDSQHLSVKKFAKERRMSTNLNNEKRKLAKRLKASINLGSEFKNKEVIDE